MKLKTKHLLIPVIVFLLLFYEACSTSAFFYVPYKEIKYSPDTSQCRYSDVYFKSSNGKTLHGWFIKPKRDTTIVATILFFHGNAGNVGYQFAPLVILAQKGFQSLVWDYEGFGKSEGKPSQETVLEDGLSSVDYIASREDVKGTNIILFGQSLGGHLACVVAAQKQNMLHALVIEGAFTSHKEIAAYRGRHDYLAPKFLARWIIPSKYNAIDEIEKITIPKLIIHSSEDETCPCFMGKQLFEKAKEPKEYWEIKGKHIACCRNYTKQFAEKFIALAK